MSSVSAEPTKINPLSEVLERAVGGPEPHHGEISADFVPAADVKVAPNEVVVYLDLPGLDEDDIQIDFLNGLLTVHGVREFDHDQEDAEEFIRIERRYGRYAFSMQLEPDSDWEQARAKYKRGVLKIRVPRDPVAVKHTLLLHGK